MATIEAWATITDISQAHWEKTKTDARNKTQTHGQRSHRFSVIMADRIKNTRDVGNQIKELGTNHASKDREPVIELKSYWLVCWATTACWVAPMVVSMWL